MKDIITPGFRLFIICAISVLLLSIVNETTKDVIAEQKENTKAVTMKKVLPKAEKFEVKEISEDNISAVAKGNNNSGYVISVSSSGFGGKIELMVGISLDGIIQGVSILSHNETPGLGAKAKEPKFIDQYKNQKVDKNIVVVKGKEASDGEVEAITASTITSNAVTAGVNEATAYFNSNLGNRAGSFDISIPR